MSTMKVPASRDSDAKDELSAAEIRAAVAKANVPTLLMVVFQVTGDERWLRAPYLPTRGRGLGDHDDGGLAPQIQASIREAAGEAIARLQSGEPPAIALPGPELVTRMLTHCMGEPISPAYGEMFAFELARRIDPGAPEVQLERPYLPAGFKTIVIGAGVAGIVAAQQLEDMGADYVVFDKQSAPGGNWQQNNYPGAGVDTPSHLYTLSFADNDWNKHFELRDSIQEYFERVISAIGVRDRFRFETEVLSARFDEDEMVWHVEVRGSDGSVEQMTANAIIGAVGVLNRPRLPNIPGVGTFDGPEFHSAEWPSDLDLTNKRVALVGTGASAMQIGPAIAGLVSHLSIFQRSPQWVAPFEKFQLPIPSQLRALLRTCPIYRGWYWLRLFWQFGDKVIDALRVDPEWTHPERSVNARNDGHREFFTRYLIDQLSGRDDLVEKALPDYPPYGKRILLDNGWFRTLKRDNVTLMTDGVVEVKPNALVSSDGSEHDVDVVIWATGFDVVHFVASMEVRGVGGTSLKEAWHDDDPRTYLGVSTPGFPNFFLLGGPHSFPGSGSFMNSMEVQMRYIRRLMTEMVRRGLRAAAVRPEVNDAYNDLIDDMHARSVWTHPGMTTYYRNARGRVIFINPFLSLDNWNMTREARLEDYVTQ